ncbi:MAG: DUF1844 domain-containing protein [Proteobacteria bacterium]|nr:DUF1844 domain-containing protein [Pseudomonadota bacterium]
MENDNKDKGEFKVVDKRRFTSGGEETEFTGSEQKIITSDKPIKPVEPQQPQVAKAEQNDAEDKIDFVSFLVSLGTQALIMLGEIPNPETRQPSINIEGAKQTIDILGMIAEKTKGNLTAEEDKLLTEILSSLRLSYVKRVGL